MKRSSHFWCITVVAVLGWVIAAAGPVKADLVTNGNFATGDFTGWALSGDTAEVYVSGVPGSFAAALSTDATDGFLTQNLGTTVGQNYTVSFLLSGDGAIPNSLKVTLGGSNPFTLTDVPNTLASPATETFTYTATSTSSLLSFDFVDDPGFLYVTDITVNPSISSVPEPSTVVTAGLGSLALMAHLGRKRRRSNQA